jgi:hypothetical protein
MRKTTERRFIRFIDGLLFLFSPLMWRSESALCFFLMLTGLVGSVVGFVNDQPATLVVFGVLAAIGLAGLIWFRGPPRRGANDWPD